MLTQLTVGCVSAAGWLQVVAAAAVCAEDGAVVAGQGTEGGGSPANAGGGKGGVSPQEAEG